MGIPHLKFSFFVFFAGLTLFANVAGAKSKKPTPPSPTDQIEVVGHISLTDGPITRFLTTQHYSSYYLYAEHGTGKNVTLIDVTKAHQPFVLGDVSYGSGSGSASLTMVAGTSALVTSGLPTATIAPASQIIRIMDFSDPKSPTVACEFTGVTATSTDDRGLIFVANPEGIWILRRHLALDPAVDKAYADYVLYGSR
jgi:hypothetical protein